MKALSELTVISTKDQTDGSANETKLSVYTFHFPKLNFTLRASPSRATSCRRPSPSCTRARSTRSATALSSSPPSPPAPTPATRGIPTPSSALVLSVKNFRPDLKCWSEFVYENVLIGVICVFFIFLSQQYPNT